MDGNAREALGGFMECRTHLRTQYLADVMAALGAYVRDGESLHIVSDRPGDRLRITLTLNAPETFHLILSETMGAQRADFERSRECMTRR